MGAGVEPGIAAAHPLHVQRPIGQVHFEQRGDLDLAAVRRLDLFRARRCGAVEEIETGDRVVRGRNFRFLDDLRHLAIGAKGHHAVTFGIGHVIAEDRAADRLGVRCGHDLGQPVAKEDIVAQHHRARRAVEEILGQDIGLGQTVRRGLDHIGDRHTPLRAIAQGALELVLVLRRGDHADLADAGQHQHRDRVVDHRLVIDRQQLFRHAHRDRVKPRAGAAGQDNALAVGHFKSPLEFVAFGNVRVSGPIRSR